MFDVQQMPLVTIRTGLTKPDGREEVLTEYVCDVPHCPNVATHALGFSREIGVAFAVCDEHTQSPPAERR